MSCKKVGFIILVFLLNSFIVFSQNNKKVITCRGTYYHNKFENRKTSSGEVFSQKLYTAAHRTLPLQTIVKVYNIRTGLSVLVRINDRCGRGGIIDLSKIAADKIGLNGTEQVRIEVLGKDYLDIWKQQDNIFNNGLMSDSLRIRYIDSLIAERKVTSQYMYLVRLTTVKKESSLNEILKNLPDKYKKLLSVEKVYNEKFYYVNIGPFSSYKETDLAIKELKKKYPSAHLIKKKDK